MARKPTTKTELNTQEVAPEVAEAFTQVQNTNAVIIAAAQSEHDKAMKVIHERAGRRQMGVMIQKLVTVTDLVDLQNIKESKSYKGFNCSDAEGKPVTVTTWDDYCSLVEGRSRETIDRDLKNLSELGPELFESMRNVGIGPITMRAIRQLPEDEKELVQQAISTTNKEDLAEFVEQLIAKNVKEKEALTKKNVELQADIESKDAVAKDNSKRINELQEKAALIRRMPVAEQAKTMRTEITGLVTEIDHDLRTNLWDALEKLRESNGDDFNDFCQLQLQELQNAIDLLKQQFATGEAWMN